MSRRPSIYVSRRLPVPSGRPPNNYFPQVTTEIRIFAPIQTPVTVLHYELWEAVNEVGMKLDLWPGPEATTREQAALELAAYGLDVPAGWRESGRWPPGPAPSS